ncbi:MAG TPA: twin-arginine translocation signal domain-containing protein, partial [Terracidiphilus sp.]|nr:twin-arginine translocation signal domain-containing protein [Terracidiphilus sp.]
MSNWSKMPRRNFLKGCAASAAGTLLPAGVLFGEDRSPDGSASARPLVGTGWRGHMFPGAVAPFGMVQLSPDTAGGPEPSWNMQGNWYGWNHCSGYHYSDNVVLGFTHTHLQGTGGGDLGDVLLMPIVDGCNWAWDSGALPALAEMQIEHLGVGSGWVFDKDSTGYRSFFSHDREQARPGYYRVHLDTPNVEAELTATTRCGMHRYRYPALPEDTRQGLVLDLAHGIGCRAYHAELNIES